ncbi:uncharacterized protein PHALS_03672 [Plasmopara halstedii]|uniref:Uncharacterized protein n=1 Tax=Plasmopara halstedii TaxID=4781 RepID=A0A0P1AX36_PLAHL|nr:uncharacterized protein PHALS_03672 [Plasmopara halstedii]CEG47006.1 hypothetical protein PHALS_03672 [Plasmopara halstedii]|eukprot:XP_024583375.1 hypothetical protein PHALS_03672 [Plasmopara halstedii]
MIFLAMHDKSMRFARDGGRLNTHEFVFIDTLIAANRDTNALSAGYKLRCA